MEIKYQKHNITSYKVTFGAYFQKYEEIFQKDCVTWPDGKKVRLLLGKFGAVEHEKYANFILPRHPVEISFQEKIQIEQKYSGSGVNFLIHDGSVSRK